MPTGGAARRRFRRLLLFPGHLMASLPRAVVPGLPGRAVPVRDRGRPIGGGGPPASLERRRFAVARDGGRPSLIEEHRWLPPTKRGSTRLATSPAFLIPHPPAPCRPATSRLPRPRSDVRAGPRRSRAA